MLKYWVWLSSCQNITSIEKTELIRAFSTPDKVYNATEKEICQRVRVSKIALNQLANKSLEETEKIIAKCSELCIHILTVQDSLYPERLLEIHDPPIVLYVKGRFPMIDDFPTLAIVGTRKCTAYALNTAESMGNDLASAGAIVVSGLADGVDQAALRGALKSGKPTIGVLGCGIDVPYPKNSIGMRKDIEMKGAVISEYPPGTIALPHHFPVRNRIISGLSCGVVIVEAPEKSGALITARAAVEQNRDVFVHLSTAMNKANAGNYALLRDGAIPVRNGADILSEYMQVFSGKINIQKKTELEKQITAERKGNKQDVILSVLKDEILHIDRIIELSGFSAAEVLSELTVMEIMGSVTQLPGKLFKREPGW